MVWPKVRRTLLRFRRLLYITSSLEVLEVDEIYHAMESELDGILEFLLFLLNKKELLFLEEDLVSRN